MSSENMSLLIIRYPFPAVPLTLPVSPILSGRMLLIKLRTGNQSCQLAQLGQNTENQNQFVILSLMFLAWISSR